MNKASVISVATVVAFTALAPTPATASPVYSASISGGNTMLDDPWGVTADHDGNIYVAERNQGVLIFGAGDTGNVAPESVLNRSGDALEDVFDVELDGDGNVYVGHSGGISVFAPGSAGDSTPIREITGFEAYGIGIGPDLSIYVTLHVADGPNDGGDIYVFSPDATGEAIPTAILRGSGDSVDVAVDEAGNVYLSNYGDDSINIWAPNPQTGDDQARSIGGDASEIGGPYGIDVDCSNGTIVLGNENNSEIMEFASTAEGDVSPIAVVDSGFYSQGLGYGQSGGLYVTGDSDGPFVNIYEYDSNCQAMPAAAALADTGTESSPIGLGAAALIAAGGIALAVRRRKA